MRGKKKAIHGNVTIATNMAGRGTDIVLGPGVAQIGGLHVVGTERHESRRIDNQLRGRCGRQGDPGSSRFFLSFEDDLLRLFVPEFTLKALNRLAGDDEELVIEHKWITRNIEGAQKKVEERNFGIRKNLLEYDEVPDEQRKSFYDMRQRVLEGRDLSDFIWEMIDETVADAIDRYYDPKYPAQCVAEWAGQNLGITLDAGRLDTSDFQGLCEQVRDLSSNEVRGTIQRTFGEYIDPEIPPDEWDIRGLLSWIAQYGINLTQRQVRDADPDDLLDQIIEAALDKITAADLAPLEQYVDRRFARERLARWAQEKFAVEVDVDAMLSAGREEAERLLVDEMRKAYQKREVEYPAGAVCDFALQRAGSNINAFLEIVTRWANRKYGLEWTYEHFAGKKPQEVFEELRDLNHAYMREGRLDQEIDAALAQHEGAALAEWARKRFGDVAQTELEDAEVPGREELQRAAYQMLRYELTMLERMVLLTTFDAVWKDHMYSMDLLRHGIGLRGYAERDPKIEYKREGTRLFNETLGNIRERVTDLIFKVQVTMRPDFGEEGGDGSGDGSGPDGGDSAYANATTQHADATNAGFATAAEDRQAAMRKQGEAGTPQTIRRETPKVGRNDPCPCGSGKKYKQCCGKKGA